MATMTASPTIGKSFRAFVYEDAGTLIKLNGVIYFFADNGEIVEFEASMAPWTTILGEVGLYEAQHIVDRLHGGAANIACSRVQEVL